MHGRAYGRRELSFDASGGLMNRSLVMQDREADSYWSIMTGESVGGALAGTPLDELPIGEKASWNDWLARHPDTLVLSVEGFEDVPFNPYDRYFSDDDGFRGQRAVDDRLDTKDPVYGFEMDGAYYAIPFRLAEGGRTFDRGSVDRLAGFDTFWYTWSLTDPETSILR